MLLEAVKKRAEQVDLQGSPPVLWHRPWLYAVVTITTILLCRCAADYYFMTQATSPSCTDLVILSSSLVPYQ